jgi:hypothetical protein
MPRHKSSAGLAVYHHTHLPRREVSALISERQIQALIALEFHGPLKKSGNCEQWRLPACPLGFVPQPKFVRRAVKVMVENRRLFGDSRSNGFVLAPLVVGAAVALDVLGIVYTQPLCRYTCLSHS